MGGRVVEPHPAAWFFTSPPTTREGLSGRTRVNELLGAAAEHPVVVVTAPSGFGKTVAVAMWARTLDASVAWLTLTAMDSDPARIDAMLLDALRRLGLTHGEPNHEPLGGLPAHGGSSQWPALRSAIEGLQERVVLVVDDVDTVGSVLTDTLLGALVAAAFDQMSIVLLGGAEPGLPLARLRVADRMGSLDSRDLRFTVPETIALAQLLGRRLEVHDAEALVDRSGGWPAAVHLALAAHVDDPRPRNNHGEADGDCPTDPKMLLADLVLEQVLPSLDTALVDFLLRATTCSRLDADLARALTGRTDSDRLLEDCLRRGLFLDRFVDEAESTVYRWHDSFMHICRAELARREPSLLREMNRIAAREVAKRGFPAAAAEFARRADDIDLVADIMRTEWLSMVLQARGAEAARLFARLPSPWADDPRITLAHACCLDVSGQRDAARLRYRRTQALLEGNGATSPSVQVVMALAALFVADSAEELARAADTVDAAIMEADLLSEPAAATALFVLGWVELRLRRDPRRAVALLGLAVAECQRFGQSEPAARARVNLAFATALAGDLNRSSYVLDEISSGPPMSERAWQSYDGGLEPFTRGFVAYYRGRLSEAEEQLRLVLLSGPDVGYSPLARVYLAFLAAARRDPLGLDAAERELELVPDVELHGVPWGLYKSIACAIVAEARGHTDRAVEIAARLPLSPQVPITAVLAAQILERAGLDEQATETLSLVPDFAAGYLRAGALVTRALMAHRAGRRSDAHASLELALDLAVPQGAAQPFQVLDDRMVALLRAHASWGTRHEDFVARLLAEAESPPAPVSLSRREREILAYLRTNLTTAEIADTLFVSVNTVKTHQRAIYRKLGVTSRRDAVRVR